MARRNMPIVGIGSFVAALFSAMLAICLITGLPCPVDGFDASAHANPGVLFRYTVTSCVVTVALILTGLFAFFYLRRNWERPGIATIVTIAFVFMCAMLWGIASSGHLAERQLLIFASIEFLVAGLIVFDPLVAAAYFIATFMIFGEALSLSGLLTDTISKDLVYLVFLDIVICWVVYGLFVRANKRERTFANQSQRDELTGARNRHCLRDDFAAHLNVDIFVMLCDIDDFKRYNDNYDHTVGDRLLVQFYHALREAFGDECVYRYGGDEFLVVSSEFGEEEFLQRTQKVSSQLDLVKIGDESAELTYSGGYVRGVAEDNEAFRHMLHQADENLLEAKRNGKNRIVGPQALAN